VKFVAVFGFPKYAAGFLFWEVLLSVTPEVGFRTPGSGFPVVLLQVLVSEQLFFCSSYDFYMVVFCRHLAALAGGPWTTLRVAHRCRGQVFDLPTASGRGQVFDLPTVARLRF